MKQITYRGGSMSYKFDFDIARSAFCDNSGVAKLGELDLKITAAYHDVEIVKIVYDGPGGGNPNVFAEAVDRQSARLFLANVYHCTNEHDIESYCDPSLPKE
jgi:hypothetical protein